jgi:hypothetical protein
MTGVRDEVATRRLVLSVMYSGPWERVTSWLYKLHQADADGNLPEVTDNSLRGRLAEWTDRRDWKWREKYVQKDTRPNDRWKRKVK